MMTREQQQLIAESVRVATPAPAKLRSLERLGDTAFDAIVELFERGSLSARRRLYALQRLALISRMQCAERREELLRLILSVTDDPSTELRSGAAVMAVMCTTLMEKSPKTFALSSEFAPGAKPSLREQVQTRLRIARDMGLSKAGAAHVDRFLANEV